MFGFIEIRIWRDDVHMLTVKKKENEVNDFVLGFLSSFNDNATYEVICSDAQGYCVMDLYGSIDRIRKCITNDKPFNI